MIRIIESEVPEKNDLEADVAGIVDIENASTTPAADLIDLNKHDFEAALDDGMVTIDPATMLRAIHSLAPGESLTIVNVDTPGPLTEWYCKRRG